MIAGIIEAAERGLPVKRTRCDILLIAGILLAAVLLWWFVRPRQAGGEVVVVQDGREIGRYPLDEELTVTIGTEDYNVLEIHDGTAAVVEANCGDHTCVRTGAISRAGETIICLPHRLEIQIIGGSAAEVDAVA